MSFDLTDEQKEAARYLARANGMAVMKGDPGCGKTAMLTALSRAWHQCGYEPVGATLAGRGAGELTDAGIAANAIAYHLERFKHARLVTRNDGTNAYMADNGEVLLHSRSIMVIDEAAQVSCRVMKELLHYSHEVGAAIRIIGDDHQTQPIEAGTPMIRIADEVCGHAEVRTILRQKGPEREENIRVIRHFGAGEARQALESLVRRNKLHLSESRPQAIINMVQAWSWYGVHQRRKTILMASKNKEVATVNVAAQQLIAQAYPGRKQEGVAIGKVTIFQHDRVQITKRHRRRGLERGDLGTCIDVDPYQGLVTVKFDKSRECRHPQTGDKLAKPFVETFATREFTDIDLGYCMTIYRAQGGTWQHGFVALGDDIQDRHAALVASSRGAMDTHYFCDKPSAGDDLCSLASRLARDRTKYLAHDLINPIPKKESSRGLSNPLPNDQEEGIAMHPNEAVPAGRNGHQVPEQRLPVRKEELLRGEATNIELRPLIATGEGTYAVYDKLIFAPMVDPGEQESISGTVREYCVDPEGIRYLLVRQPDSGRGCSYRMMLC